MILCRQISDVIANGNARYKRNELELAFSDYCRLGDSVSQTHLDFCLFINVYQHNELHTDEKI